MLPRPKGELRDQGGRRKLFHPEGEGVELPVLSGHVHKFALNTGLKNKTEPSHFQITSLKPCVEKKVLIAL